MNKAELDKTVTTALKCVREINKRMTPPLMNDLYFGSIEHDPQQLIVCYIFADEQARAEAEAAGHCARITQQTVEALREAGYPAEVLDSIRIAFEGEKEIIDHGGYYAYFYK
ncbi:MAG: hypothetical protein U0694_09490 [Anaerolineae bacterium]